MRWLGQWLLWSVLFLAVAFTAAAQTLATTARTIEVAGLSRTYYLHVPVNIPKDRAVALVLMFHGGGGTPAWTERESRFSEWADREGFLVAYPQGYKKSWNDGREDRHIAAQRDHVDDLAFVAALLDDLGKKYKLDSKRVFATGISNGATFSQYLGAHLSTRIAAIAPVAGGIAEPLSVKFNPEKPVSVLIMNGTQDPLVPYLGGKITLPWGTTRGAIISTESAVAKWVDHNGCRAEPVTADLPDKDAVDDTRVKRLSYTGCREGTEVVLYRIEGGGHTWPGRLQYLPKRVIGNMSYDINATEIIWAFFTQHPKP
jgi:polyhydroxybutyrate depolymerase